VDRSVDHRASIAHRAAGVSESRRPPPLKRSSSAADGTRMSRDRDMPAAWLANARRRRGRLDSAVERAREVSRAATTAPDAPAASAAPVTTAGRIDELARKRSARRAAEEARRRATSFEPPPGPQAC